MSKQTKEIIGFLVIGLVLVLFVIGYRHMRDHPHVNLEEKYIGETMGKKGKVRVAISIDDNKIANIEILENKESKMAKKVFQFIAGNVIKNNSLSVDSVTGATRSSKDIKDAIADAVSKSGIPLVATVNKSQNNHLEDVYTDIVVVGGGGAGLTSAITTKEKGVNVLLVEKLPILGGNTKFATGGLNASGTKFQKGKNIKDTPEKFIEDTLKGGKYINNKNLVNILANKSSDIITWLSVRGMDLSDVGRLGGASVDRAHRPKGGAPVGDQLFDTLENTAKTLGVDIRVATKATEILYDDNKVIGIAVKTIDGETYHIYAKSVILATGGFGANQELVTKYRSDLKDFGTTNSPGATGDAVDLLKDLNVSFVDMKEIQIHPTVVPNDNHLITEAVRGNGAILVNKLGKRFVNELNTRDVVSQEELKQEDKMAFLIFDENVRKSLKAIEKYADEGLLTKASSLNELAKALEINSDELSKTIDAYNQYLSNGEDKDFGRKSMKSKIEKSNFYGIKVAPAVHYTMGGIKINEKAQVLNKRGEVIKGLFAAGEVTGGIHGANRLGGNSLTDITVFGKIAGDSAYENLK
ncbi:flavocytochrome c [Crassaminicella profunda]|uniref:flavocytochrome c n=1 Tax=Crassaminicella profunda TaxID=1286698 RepID=UPI001CA7607B|nr:flavocytochrome c [Crassaminicella profunda]QZY53925.1 flavocytochrome c [Crassaminicella profunda]